MTREEMIENLHKGVCTVTFDKVNGEKRVMRCTLSEGFLPAPEKAEAQGVLTEMKQRSQSVLPVWDVDLNEWRSFRIDSVSLFSTPQVLTEG